MRVFSKVLILIIGSILFLMPMVLLAQPGDPGGDPEVPITGIEILIGIGSLFGASRFFKNRINNKKH